MSSHPCVKFFFLKYTSIEVISRGDTRSFTKKNQFEHLKIGFQQDERFSDVVHGHTRVISVKDQSTPANIPLGNLSQPNNKWSGSFFNFRDDWQSFVTFFYNQNSLPINIYNVNCSVIQLNSCWMCLIAGKLHFDNFLCLFFWAICWPE